MKLFTRQVLENILQEISPYAPKTLVNLEKPLAELRKSKNNKKARQEIVQIVKEFTQIPNVILHVTDDLNAGVLPIYDENTISQIFTSFFQKFKDMNDVVLKPDELKKLKHAVEKSDCVKTIYLFIGYPLLRNITPNEMIAILLHEFGHVFSAKSSIPDIVLKLLKQLLQFAAFPIILLKISMPELVPILVRVSILIFGLVHGISFLERRDEYGADKYVVKYGYGDELVSAMYKLSDVPFYHKKQSIFDKIEVFFLRILHFLISLINPQTHPSGGNRVQALENLIFNEYRKIYPKYRDVFNHIQADYQTTWGKA